MRTVQTMQELRDLTREKQVSRIRENVPPLREKEPFPETLQI